MLYGIGMGGEWGVGASLAVESRANLLRGVVSGILQSGYSMGYLLAAVAARVVLPNLGWRAMFWVGGLPALLALYIRFNVKESEAWKQHRVPTMGAVVRTAMSYWKIFSYLALLMTLMVFLSHGTQDLYPDFLKSVHGVLPKTVSYLVILFAAGTGTIEYALRNHFGYAWAIAGFEITNILILATVVALGSERHGKDFGGQDPKPTAVVLSASSVSP